MEQQKKLRLNQIMQLNEQMIRMVKVGPNVFATLDDHTTGQCGWKCPKKVDLWTKDQVSLTDVSEALWSDAPLDKPPAIPESWIYQLADEVEIGRLLSVNVLQKH